MSKLQIDVEFQDQEVEIPEDATYAKLTIKIRDTCITRKRSLDDGEISDSVFGPILGVVDWLIDNWVYILSETEVPFNRPVGFFELGPDDVFTQAAIPGVKESLEGWKGCLPKETSIRKASCWHGRHQLGWATSNLAIPSIMIVPLNEYVVLAIDQLPSRMNPSVEFISSDDKPITPLIYLILKTDFKDEISKLITTTIDRINSQKCFDINGCSRLASWLKARWVKAQDYEKKNHKT